MIYRKYFKRLLDLLLSICALPVAFLIVVACGLAIWLEDRGPILYFSLRLGRGGRVFTMYKLRTMKVNAPDIRNADGSTFNSQIDPRQTQVGKLLRKTSLDELPQLWNVVLGDMSLVGPRPDLPEHLVWYSPSEMCRLSVAPGITGYSQAYFRNSIEWKERRQHDVKYVLNISLWEDIRIIIRTIYSVMFSQGVYNSFSKSDFR